MKSFLLLTVLAAMLAGCSGSESASSPAGAEANTGKTYTAEDANAAQPKRGGGGN